MSVSLGYLVRTYFLYERARDRTYSGEQAKGKQALIKFLTAHPLPRVGYKKVPEELTGEFENDEKTQMTVNIIWAFAKMIEQEMIERPNEEELACLRDLPYDDYLETGHWQFIRREALKRADYRCSLCNAAVKLHDHHRTYERLGCEEPEDTIAICNDCHDHFHHRLPKSSAENQG